MIWAMSCNGDLTGDYTLTKITRGELIDDVETYWNVMGVRVGASNANNVAVVTHSGSIKVSITPGVTPVVQPTSITPIKIDPFTEAGNWNKVGD